MSRDFKDFPEFYNFYKSEHRHPTNRALHFAGNSSALIAVLMTLVSGNFWWLAAGLISTYGCAWLGHFLSEKNRPATFKYPFYSLMGDWVMYKDMWLGRLKIR